MVRLLGLLGLAAGIAAREGGFGALGLALISLLLVLGAPVLAFVATAIAVGRDRGWPDRFWRIALVGLAAAFDISWIASGRQFPANLILLSFVPPVLDSLVAFVVVPGAARRGARWYLALCVTALAVFLALAAISGVGPNGTWR